MKLFENIPIEAKFRHSIMFTSIAVLVLTFLSFFIYEYHTFRQTTASNLSTLGEIIAANSTAALAFENKEDAAEVLSALSAEGHIVSATLFDQEGNVFSQYPRNTLIDVDQLQGQESGYRFGDNFLHSFQRVEQNGRFLGTLYLKSDLEAMSERFKLYGLIVFLVFAIAVLLAYQLSRLLQKSISRPLVALAETARSISEKKDYTVRATKPDNYELGSLTDAFNHMLTQIEQRDEALSGFNKKLENKVIERTQKLEEANQEQKEAEIKIQQKNQELGMALTELKKTEEELIRLNNELEKRVQERTNELKLSEEKLKTKNKELEKINVDLDNFVYRASHDLKSPISNIEGLTLILNNQLEGRLEEDEKKLMEMIEISLAKFRGTINDLTEISKVQKDQDYEDEKVVFKEVLKDVKEDIWKMIEDSGANIRADFKVSAIEYAKYNLRSILYNLISNAIKYRNDERPLKIDIYTFQENEKVVLMVKDNGLGMSIEDQAKIFTMFKRLHAHVEGSGIGLYITKRIIENKGGRIEVESDVEQGSTFRVYF